MLALRRVIHYPPILVECAYRHVHSLLHSNSSQKTSRRNFCHSTLWEDTVGDYRESVALPIIHPPKPLRDFQSYMDRSSKPRGLQPPRPLVVIPN